MNHVVNPPSPLDSRISTCGWIFEDLLKKGKRFRPVPRVPLKEATKAIIRFDKDGVPLIIEDLHKESGWPKEDFHPDWLKDNGYKEISVRNVYDWTDKIMIFEDFIEKSRSMPTFASPQEQERLYGKDAECPGKWAKWLCDSKVVPSPLIPDNVDDLLSSRHVETLMCYIGVGDTFTPCHKDLCASSGQNLMCYTEMDGSSFWFMTKGADAPEASKYFHELKQELDHETHVISVEQLANAPFDVYVAEQRLGDLVLVPPRSCHQVVNYGGITIKTSWSRMTLRGLEIAYYHELPIYRRVCRPEIYRVKSTIFQTLIKRRDILLSLKGQAVLAPKTGDKKLISTTKDLLNLFDSVLLEESPTPNRRFPCLQPITSLNHSPDSLVMSSTLIDQLTCDFCGADIFQSFFECLSCVNAPNGSKIEHGDGFVICAGCYIEGRSCKCGNMDPIQCRPFQELLAVRNKVADLLSVNKHDLIPSLKDNTSTLATGIFRAACKLQEIRKTRKGEERTCSTIVAGSSHLVPCSWVLNCKKCHRSRCFKHILMSQKLHSADALLIHASDSSHEEHHRHHGSSLQNYDEGSDRFFQTQRMGSKPDFTQQRAHLAEQYHTCKPLNSAFIQAGWYDVHVQLVPTIIEAKDNSTNSSQDSLTPPASPPLSPLTDLDSPLPLQVLPAPVKTTTVANMSPSLKRKRTVLHFVDVPSRMHKVRVSEKLAVTPGGPEPSKSQETFADLQVTSQLLSSDSTTPSVIADNVICERDQEVMQTDPLSSPPTSRRNKASSHSTSQMLLILSTSEADSSNSSSFPSHKNKSKKQTFKKPQPLPSSPTSVMSHSTPTLPRSTSSTLTRSPQPVNRLQTRIVPSTGESEKNSRLDRSFPPPITPDLGLARITDSEESRRKLVPVRKLPRIKKTFRTTQRVSPEVSSCQSSSSSSVYPRSTSTPSDVIDLAQVINGAVNKNYSALEALDADPPLTEQTPSNNNTVPQAVHTTLTDSAALHKAISDITDAARNMTQLHNMPSQSHDPIRAAATAPGEV
ncbi:hypothetical protein J132_00771 [Termitomyces sp. J132]|nr:hypothetical protein J132_00771 [Termitomyces sp. J132]